MSERDDAGQFTSAEPEVFGRTAEERESGYTSLASLEGAGADEFASAEDAASAFLDAGLSIDDSDEPTPVYLGNLKTQEPFDENVTVSAEVAGDHLNKWQSDVGREVETLVNADMAAQIDRDRAEQIHGDPRLAEHYGVEMPKVEPAADAAVDPAATPAVSSLAFQVVHQ